MTARAAVPARRRALIVLIVCALSAVYLWLALHQMDLAALRRAVSELSVPLAPVLLALALATLGARASRIALSLVRVKPVTAREAARSMMAGYFTSLILPQPAGELARIAVATRDLGVTAAAATAAIAVERVLDLTLALLLISLSTPFAAHTDTRLVRATQWLTPLALLGCLTLALATSAPTTCRALLHPLFAALPPRIERWARRHLEELLQALGALTTAHRIVRYLALTVAQTALWACCIAVSLWAAGIDPRPVPVILTTAIFTLALMLPSAPGYIGSLQLAYIVALVPLGVALPKAFAASLYLHVLFNGLLIVLGFSVFGKSIINRDVI